MTRQTGSSPTYIHIRIKSENRVKAQNYQGACNRQVPAKFGRLSCSADQSASLNQKQTHRHQNSGHADAESGNQNNTESYPLK